MAQRWRPRVGFVGGGWLNLPGNPRISCQNDRDIGFDHLMDVTWLLP
jgi:hypothetical protein